MKYVIFAGTTEGRKLSLGLSKAGIPHVLCVATDYGEMLIEDNPLVTVHKGRMDEDEMREFLRENGDVVFDATHPYANIVTKNIKAACEKENKEYVRIIREADGGHGRSVYFFDDVKGCEEALRKTKGNILLTTGSKDLKTFSVDEGVRERLYARVLPSRESLGLCENAGLKGEHIIAMQGPFNVEMNKALIRQFKIETLVTKESGATGGYPEKIHAAEEMGIDTFVIGRPLPNEEGITLKEALKRFGGPVSMTVNLIGIGPGGREYLTEKAAKEIESSEIIFGAERMIRDYKDSKRTYPYYLSKDVSPILLKEKPERVSILFSGDTGFFSGEEKMKKGLDDVLKDSGTDYTINVIPGISSLSYFSARIRESYGDGTITSIHGKDEEAFLRLMERVKEEDKVFTLLSGREDVYHVCRELVSRGLEDAEIVLGCDLSYPQEEITKGSPKDFLEGLKEGLYVMLIKRAGN